MSEYNFKISTISVASLCEINQVIASKHSIQLLTNLVLHFKQRLVLNTARCSSNHTICMIDTNYSTVS